MMRINEDRIEESLNLGQNRATAALLLKNYHDERRREKSQL
jgi:hypothetical protein